MIPSEIPPDLLTKSAPELLRLVVTGGLSYLSKEGWAWVHQRIKELWDTRAYGITPDPETANGLKKVNNSDAFKRIKDCIGTNNEYLHVVRLALLIEDLSYHGTKKEISEMKNRVFKKYGREGLTILNMGSVGVLVFLIEHLSKMKIKENYSQEEMFNIFKDTIGKWRKISIYHQNVQGTRKLISEITTMMNQHHDFFFVFGIGEAADQAKAAIVTLKKNHVLKDKGYMADLILRKADSNNLCHYGWAFEWVSVRNFEKMTL